MIKFTGRIIRDPLGHEPDYYDVRLCGPLYDEEGVRMCGGVASALCEDSFETMAWGYEGRGPNHLAAALLAYSHAFNQSGVFLLSIWNGIGKPIAMKHHNAFAIEIVKHFGETWEISADKVQAWVNKEEEKKEFQLNAAT